MKTTSVFDSNLFAMDKDFELDYLREKHGRDYTTAQEKRGEYKFSDEENEDLYDKKMEYYMGEFWVDCDYIQHGDDTFDRCKVDEQIILRDEDMDDVLQKIIVHYMSKDWNDKSIAPDFDGGDRNAKLTNKNDADVWIKYRGGAGYTYAFCGYNYVDFNK